mmetsp:Transcript_74009/g.120159  ORF Transcript_74009/g.120159 Transcript_74009/m.120159 type:complete len:146 (+) Transcript_74009:45-482(+)
MVFLSSYSAVAKLSYLCWDSVLLGTVSWKVMRFGELEDDHLNPTDFSNEVNKIYPVEVGLHAALVIWLFVHWEITLLLMNVPYLAFTIMMFLDKSYHVDAATVYTKDFKKGAKQKVLISLIFFGIMFCVYLASMVSTLIAVGSKK